MQSELHSSPDNSFIFPCNFSRRRHRGHIIKPEIHCLWFHTIIFCHPNGFVAVERVHQNNRNELQCPGMRTIKLLPSGDRKLLSHERRGRLKEEGTRKCWITSIFRGQPTQPIIFNKFQKRILKSKTTTRIHVIKMVECGFILSSSIVPTSYQLQIHSDLKHSA